MFNRSEYMKRLWCDPEYRKRVSDAISNAQQQRLNEMVKISKSNWDNPDFRSRQKATRIRNNSAHKMSDDEKLILICEMCHGQFKVLPSRKSQRFCNRRCRVLARTGVPNIKNRGRTPSKRCGSGIRCRYKGIVYRSLYELSFVVNYLEQRSINATYESMSFKWRDSTGRLRKYTPDFFDNVSKTIYEVKYHKALTFDDIQQKLEQARIAITADGWTLCVMTEREFDVLSYESIAEMVHKGTVELLPRKHGGSRYQYLLKKIELNNG